MNWTREQSEEYLANGRKKAVTFKTPLIVKPNSLSGGKGVSYVDLSSELVPAINSVFSLATDVRYIAIVQEYIAGKEYRLVLLDGELQLCYEKKYLSIVGDEGRSVEELIRLKNQQLKLRDGKIEQIDPSSAILRKILNREHLQLNSVMDEGTELVLNDITFNLEAGAEAVNVTDSVNQGYLDMARLIAEEMRLRYLGIDFRAPSISAPASEAIVLEVNGNPGLTHFYLQGNKEKVFEIYEKLLRIMLE
jgi:D-alanine-D-alanine ligase-like ATP-grasp enzyme